jgi:hypothetical protein
MLAAGRFSKSETCYDLGPVVHEGRTCWCRPLSRSFISPIGLFVMFVVWISLGVLNL